MVQNPKSPVILRVDKFADAIEYLKVGNKTYQYEEKLK